MSVFQGLDIVALDFRWWSGSASQHCKPSFKRELSPEVTLLQEHTFDVLIVFFPLLGEEWFSVGPSDSHDGEHLH